MSTKHPKINLVIERPLFETIKTLSEQNDLSLSSQIRSLVLEALENIEDIELVKLAEERYRTFNHHKAITHKEMWDGLSKKKSELLNSLQSSRQGKRFSTN